MGLVTVFRMMRVVRMVGRLMSSIVILGTMIDFSMSSIGKVADRVQRVVVRSEMAFIGALLLGGRKRIVIFNCFQMVFNFLNGVFSIMFCSV